MIDPLKTKLKSLLDEPDLNIKLNNLLLFKKELLLLILEPDVSSKNQKEILKVIKLITNTVNSPDTVLTGLKKIFFNIHSVSETQLGLEKMFLSYMCSDEAEDSTDRQSATVTYQLLKKLLDSVY